MGNLEPVPKQKQISDAPRTHDASAVGDEPPPRCKACPVRPRCISGRAPGLRMTKDVQIGRKFAVPQRFLSTMLIHLDSV